MRVKWILVFMTFTIAALPVNGEPIYVGARHQNTYEDDPNTGLPWRDESEYRNDICGGFVTEMAKYDDVSNDYFIGDLSKEDSEELFLEAGRDRSSHGVDNTDIHMTCTHAGAWDPSTIEGRPATFTLVMYHYGKRAFSYQMRLGDDARKNKLFVIYGCDTMKDDSYIVDRWQPVFEGGLKYAAAFWDYAYPSSDAKDLGKTYAKKLHESGYSFRYAWLDSMDDYTGNTPAVMASGKDREDCRARRRDMNLDNFRNTSLMPRLKDSDVGHLCWTRRVPQ